MNEIIQKFTTQDETNKSLNDLKQEYLEKIEYLFTEKQRLKEELNDLKSLIIIQNDSQIDGKPNIIVNDDTLLEALAQCVEKMKTIYPLVKNDPSFDPEKFRQFFLISSKEIV